MKIYLRYATCVYFMFFAAIAHSLDENHDKTPNVYVSSASPMSDIDIGMEKAKQRGTNLLLVMGAQWCHDSRGLASKFAKPEVAALLNDNYEVVFVDVGFYNDLRYITNRFGQASYFATPTVMVINPQNEEVVNRGDMDIWGSADSIPVADYLDYFSRYSTIHSASPQKISEKNKEILDTFTQNQAARLQLAYGRISSIMKERSKTKERDDSFMDLWGEVRNFRIQLQRDIKRLRQQANDDFDTVLTLPTYSKFSWESE